MEGNILLIGCLLRLLKSQLFANIWGMLPLNLFILISKTLSAEFPKHCGISPLKLLFPTSITCKLKQLIKDGGNGPSSLLPFSLRKVKLQSFAYVCGMIPWKLFIRRSKNFTVELTRHCGICPLKLLLDISRYWIELKLQNDEGISPVKLLSNTKTHLLWDGRSRSDSESQIQVEDIWDFSTERFFILVGEVLSKI